MPRGMPRLVVISVAVAFALLVIVVGEIYIRSLNPAISQSDATSAAIAHLQGQVGNSAWSLIAAHYDAAPDKIYDERGNLIGSESRSSCRVFVFSAPAMFCHAHAAWIVHLRAAGPSGSARDAYVVVNASTGDVTSSSVVMT